MKSTSLKLQEDFAFILTGLKHIGTGLVIIALSVTALALVVMTHYFFLSLPFVLKLILPVITMSIGFIFAYGVSIDKPQTKEFPKEVLVPHDYGESIVNRNMSEILQRWKKINRYAHLSLFGWISGFIVFMFSMYLMSCIQVDPTSGELNWIAFVYSLVNLGLTIILTTHIHINREKEYYAMNGTIEEFDDKCVWKKND